MSQSDLYAKTIKIGTNRNNNWTYWTTDDNYRIVLKNAGDKGNVKCGPPGSTNQVWLLRGSEDKEGLVSILSIQHDKRQPLAVTYDPDAQLASKKFSVRPFVPYDVTQLFKFAPPKLSQPQGNNNNYTFQSTIDNQYISFNNTTLSATDVDDPWNITFF